MIISVSISFLLSVGLIPLIMLFCKKKELYDYVDERKNHQGNIPRLGALGFVPAFIISVILFGLLSNEVSVVEVLPPAIGALVIFGFGVLDDIINMKAMVKFLVQSVVAVAMAACGLCFNNILGIELGWFGFVLTYCWIIGMVNSFNLIDGSDGLCGGISMLVSLGVAACNYTNPLIAAVCLCLSASLLGFLVYNKPDAKIFMGDGGSQFLGYIIAVLPLFPVEGHFEETKFFAIIVLCSIPLIDTFAAMWRRTREHRSFFSPDKSHLHHKLQNLGFKKWGILALLYSIQIVLMALVFFASRSTRRNEMVIYCTCIAIMLIFFSILHYANRAVLRERVQNEKQEKVEKSGE